MRGPRSSRRFELLGAVRAERLGLSARRCRELKLTLAWQRIAGETLAALARPVRICRGVLELELLTSDEARRRTLEESSPDLCTALGGEFPDLGIKRIRLLDAERETAPETRPPGNPTAATTEGGRPAGRGALHEVMERYLARARGEEFPLDVRRAGRAPGRTGRTS